MRVITRNVFSTSLLYTALISALGLKPVIAQESDAETNKGTVDEIETIIVTSSKRTKSLQDTPLSVSVTSQQVIEQAKIQDISDLQALVPSLRVTQANVSANTTFSIRGFGNGANNAGIEPSVGVFVDGVYRSRAGSQIVDLPRLERIEVLRGPQSTLFGKNASAGVISVVTAKPSYDAEGKIEFGIGNYNQKLIKGYYSQGVSDNFAVAVSGGINKRDGFSDSLTGLSQLNDRDRWNARVQALYEPTNSVSFRFIADHSEIDEVCCTVANVINGPTALAIQALGGEILSDETPFSYKSALNKDPSNIINDGGWSLQADVEYDDFSLTSISAYRTTDLNTSTDDDFTSLDLLQGEGAFSTNTLTQEFRLTSKETDTLEWMIGAYYFEEKVTRAESLIIGNDLRPYFDVQIDAILGAAGVVIPGGLLGVVENLTGNEPGSFFRPNSHISTDYEQNNTAYSIFATFDYHLFEQLTATFGMNYTDDEKKVEINQRLNEDLFSSFNAETINGGIINAVLPGTLPLVQGFQFSPPFLDFPNVTESGKSADSKATWTVRLAYELNRNWNFYGSAATGFKASSWNLSRDSLPNSVDQPSLEANGLTQVNQRYGSRFARPEESTVYELGIKGLFSNASLNIAIFDQSIEGFQSSTYTGSGFILANAGKQSTKGLEIDAVYSVTDSLMLSFSGTFLEPIYDSFTGGYGINGPIDLSGTKPVGIHEQSVNISGVYDFEINDEIFGYVRFGYLWESPTRVAINTPSTIRREVNMLNASIGLDFGNGIGLQIWGRNLTSDEYFQSAFPGVIQEGTFNAYPNQPKTFGLSITYDWSE